MPDSQTFTRSIQEDIVTVVAFVTDEHTRYISSVIEPGWFDEPFREVIRRSLKFWQDHKRAPGSEHIDSLFDEIIADPQHREYRVYVRILSNMHEFKHSMQTDYVRKRVHVFARRQKMRSVIQEAATILLQQEVTEEEFDHIDQMFGDVMNFHPVTTDIGFRLSDTDRALAFLDDNREGYTLPLGIEELDANHIYPRKGEVLLFLAPVNRGKSMWLHFVGCAGMNRGWRVLHITLENSEASTAQRYIQTNLGYSKTDGLPKLTRFETNDKKELARLYSEEDRAIPMFPKDDYGGEDFTREKLRRVLGRKLTDEYRFKNLVIKAFETGELSFEKYEAYLDQLAYTEKFVPDLVVIDYPWLMNIGGKSSETRLAYGRLSQHLRGSAVRRNYALAVASQLSQRGTVAEDYSQLWTCDYAIEYSQTDQEAQMGVARLFVRKARNERAHQKILISQNYATSTFCVDSVRMTGTDRWKQMVKDFLPQDVPTTDDDE